jgi:hypothetical protein
MQYDQRIEYNNNNNNNNNKQQQHCEMQVVISSTLHKIKCIFTHKN